MSPFNPTLRRQFCGYCGTQLSQWTEDDEQDIIHVTLGSLFDEDLDSLEEKGLLDVQHSDDEQADEDMMGGQDLQVARSSPLTGLQHRGAPWFESIVEKTALGRVKRQRGGHASLDGTVEWEVIEYTEGDDEGDHTPGKRKIAEVEEPEDQDMRA